MQKRNNAHLGKGNKVVKDIKEGKRVEEGALIIDTKNQMFAQMSACG